ncbi:MAG: hypothetical protein VX346_10055 [Planctomycetota bacterium]|nr:hypothetical protein [Planctomycetota bacterium]
MRGREHVSRDLRLRPTSNSYSPISCRLLACLVVLLATCVNPAVVQGENQPRRLTFDGRLKRDPVFINQGREIIYAVQHENPRLVLYRLRLSDGHKERLHPDSPLPEFRPVYSRDETTFAYLQMTGNDRLTVQVRRVGMPQPLVVKPTAAVIWHAALTPDGQHLLYAASGQLRMYPLSGGTERTLTETEGRNNWPSVSPNGRQVAFGSSRLGNYDLFTLDLDQKTTRRLTTNKSMDARPTWSPDGKQIAFVSTRHRNYELYLIGHDGNGLTRVTQNPERDDYPSWHPDGQHLVSVSQRDGETDLFLHSISPR